MKKLFLMTVAALVMAACNNNTNQNTDDTMTQKPIPGTDGNKYVPFEQRTGDAAVVYFTRDLSPEGLIKAYEQVNGNIEGKVAVYCRGGRRSLAAAEQFAAQGCKVYNLDGGILAWQKAGKPTTTVETDVFATKSGKLVKIHALLHASICIEYDGKTVYIDPVAKLRDRTVDYTALPKADMVLVTHEHFDHYDTATLKALACEDLVMNSRCVELYGSGTAMGNGERLTLDGDIALEAVPAYNTTEGHLQFHPKGRDNG